MELAVKNVAGETVKKLNVDDQVFGLKPHRAVVHQTMLAQLANRRAGSAHTKTRSEVKGSTAKLRRQKGSGRARMGSMSSPHLRGGGVAFGPRHRSFAQRLPNRMRRLALRSLLSAKAAEGSISVLDGLKVETPRTKEIISVLRNLGLERSTLIVTAEPDRTVLVSSRNLPATKVLPAAYLNVLDLLACRNLLMTVDAVRKVEELWGGDRAGARRRKGRGVEPTPAPAGAVPEAKKSTKVAVEAVGKPVTAEAAPKPRRRSRAASERAAKPEEPAPATARRGRQPSAKATRTVNARAKKAPETQEAAPAEEAAKE